MSIVRRYLTSELQRPRKLFVKAFSLLFFFFIFILWREHQAISSLNPTNPLHSSSSITPKRSLSKVSSEDVTLSIIVLAQSKHLLHTRNSLHSIDEHVSRNPDLFSSFSSSSSSSSSSYNYEILVAEVGYDYHRRNGLRRAMDLCPQCTLVLTNDTKNEKHQPLTTAINAAAGVARGEYIFFLTDSTELTDSSVYPLLSEISSPSSSTVGVLGGRLLGPDQTIVHGGVDFIMTRKSKFGPFSNKNFPSPMKKYAGYPKTHPHSLVKTLVPAVVLDSMFVKRSIFTSLSGFNETFGDKLSYAEFCQRVRAQGYGVKYVPDSVSYNFEGEEGETEDDAVGSWGSDAELLAFYDVWGSIIERNIESTYQVRDLTLRWNMECGAGQTLGFTTEAIYFMLGLEGKVDLKIEVNNAASCKTELQKAGLPRWVIRSVMRLASKHVKSSNKNVLVIHRDPGRYNYFVSHAEQPVHYIVGRSMYETDRIPADWPKPCNESVREIWVPSHFNVETFSSSGVDRSKLIVVPEPIDTITYDPEVTEPLELRNKKSFAFLAVMKWEQRKGWDTLLRAYLKEFSASDDVSLFLRSNMDAKNRHIFEEFVKNTTEKLLEENPKKTFPQLPQTEDALLPYLGMPSLYKAADCLVLSSHGEGWGLPIIEAMAMGLPTIATNWSGNTEFMTPENSYLIEVESLVNATVQDHKWAQPSETHLRTLMRRVYTNPSEAKQKGSVAKENVKQYFSTDKVGDIVIQQLKRIKEKLDAEPQTPAPAPPNNKNNNNNNNNVNTNANNNINNSPNNNNNNNNPPASASTTTSTDTRVKTKMKIVAV